MKATDYSLSNPCAVTQSYFSVQLTVHLDQEFGFDPAAGFVFVGCSSSAADGVDLIYEDGRGSVKSGL